MEEFFLAFASGARHRVGRLNALSKRDAFVYSMVRKYFTYISYETGKKHEVSYMLDVLRWLQLKIENQKMELWIPDSDECLLNDRIDIDRTLLIAISPVGSVSSKNWPPSKFHDAMMRIYKEAQRDVHFVLLGDYRAVEAATSILDDTPSSIVSNLTAKTNLMQAAAVLKKCSLYIGADTGLMHMAAALGVPCVELAISLPGHTWSDFSVPERCGPWGVDYIALQPPHGLGKCVGVCREKYPHCITQITVDEVVEAACRLLNKREKWQTH